MIRDEQARARLVEIALSIAEQPKCPACYGTGNFMLGTAPNACRECDGSAWRPLADSFKARQRAGMNPCKGSWCAAGLTAAMEDAGLLVPEPGAPARRGAIALLDFVAGLKKWAVIYGEPSNGSYALDRCQPGDIIAWLQYPLGKDPAGWRRGHVAAIVAVDDESITTVGWNEGPSPGRVMKRRLWRGDVAKVHTATGKYIAAPVPNSSTVLYRRPGGLYGVARPVAR